MIEIVLRILFVIIILILFIFLYGKLGFRHVRGWLPRGMPTTKTTKKDWKGIVITIILIIIIFLFAYFSGIMG